MATATELITLKEQIQRTKDAASRLQGKRETLLDELKACGVETLRDAEKLLAEKRREVAEQEKQLDSVIRAFQERYHD